MSRRIPRVSSIDWLTAHFAAVERALAVALMIASDVIVAPLVASTPLTPCLAMSFFGGSDSG
jgi:hypothetical protein